MWNFRKKIICLFLLISLAFHVSAEETTGFNPTSPDEALFLRRIAEFWHDGEYEIAKHQIDNYLINYPESSLSDSLYAILGNIYINEKNYSKAIAAYDSIQSEDIKDKIAINMLGSLYHLKWYERLIEECEQYIGKTDNELNHKIRYLQALSLYNRAKELKDDSGKHEIIIKKAIDKFEKLINTNFETEAREYLSQIHSNLNDFENASKCYMDLAEQKPSKKEEYLFQAALLQAHFDKEKAIETFGLITDIESTKSAEAAYNKILLLYELKRYDDLIAEGTSLLPMLMDDQLSLANFFIGRSHFNLKNYFDASSYLKNSLEMEDQSSYQMKLALIMLMQSSYHLNNFELFNSSFNSFLEKFPNDEKTFESHFARALLNKKNEHFDEAKIDFEEINKNFVNLEKSDRFLFEYAHLLYIMGDVTSSRAQFKDFINGSENKELIKSSLSHLVNCSIKILNSFVNENDLTIPRQNLVNDIDFLMKHSSLFNQKEQFQYRHLVAKTHFDLSNYVISFELLQNLLNDNIEEEVLQNNQNFLSLKEYAEINLLTGFCHKKIYENLTEFITYSEKAIRLDSNIENVFGTYINLFNSYLTLSKESQNINQEKLIKAATYLFKAYEIHPQEITQTNLIWLSDFYIHKIKTYLSDFKNKLQSSPVILDFVKNATIVFENLNKAEEHNNAKYMLNLAYLFKCQNNNYKAEIILQSLVKELRFFPERNWEYKGEIIYELANICVEKDEKQNAISLYEEFIMTLKKDSKYKSMCNLHLARLKLNQISKEDFNFNNIELEKIISTLKTLSLQKIFENEPTHLEAALDYVDILCYMEKEKEFKKRLFLLGRLKDNFISNEDLISQDYQTMKKIVKDKEKIYNAYMTAVDAEKFICMGYLEQNITHIITAKDSINALINENAITTKYLNDRISKMIILIEEFTID